MLITAMYLDYFFLFLLVDIKVIEYMEIVITGQIVCFVSLSRSVNFVPVQYLSCLSLKIAECVHILSKYSYWQPDKQASNKF